MNTSSYGARPGLRLAAAIIAVLGFVIFFGFLNPGSTHAATGINPQLNYQGRLLDNTGAVVADGTYNMEFKIYQDGDGCVSGGSSPCSGTLKWTETRTSTDKVTVKNGYFSVNLGSVTAFGGSVDWNQDTLWLSINIGGTGSPTWDGEMTPFKRLTSTPYALNSSLLQGLQAANFVQLAQGVQNDTSTSNASIFINKNNSSGSPNILELQKSGSDVLTLNNSGQLLLQPAVDGNALQVKNNAGKELLTVDTTSTGQVLLGKTGSSGLNGSLVFNTTNASNTAITISAASTGASYSLTLPTTGPSTAQCLQSDASVASQLKFASCSGSVSFNNVTAGTNTNALVIGTGGSLTTSGTGTITSTGLTADYVASIANGTGITGGAAGSNAAALTLGIDQTAGLTWTGNETFNGAFAATPSGTNSFVVNSDADSNFQVNYTSSTDATLDIAHINIIDNASASSGALYGLAVVNNDNGANTGVPDALAYLKNANAAETVPDGLLIEQTGAGTLTNGLEIKQTAGAITNGLTFTGTFGTSTLKVGSSTVLDGSGVLQSVGLSGTYSNAVTLSATTNSYSGNSLNIAATSVPGSDIATISNAGQGVTTAGVNGLSIAYEGGNAAVEAAGARIDVTPGGTSGGIWSGMRVVANGTGPVSGVTEYGIKVEGPTSAGAGTAAGVYVGTGWDIGLDVQSGGLQLSSLPSNPATPSSGNLRVYAKSIAGRTMLKSLGSSGIDYALQPSLFQQSVFLETPGTGATLTTYSATGGSTTSTGTLAAAGGGATESQGFMGNMVTGAVAGNTAGTGNNVAQYYRGSVANGADGFFYFTRISLPDALAKYANNTTGSRLWFGLSSGTVASMVGNDNPAGDYAGFQFSGVRDTAPANFKFITKDNTTQNVTDTGVLLAVSKTYDFYIYCSFQCTSINWRIDNQTDGSAPVEGTVSTNMPRTTIAMRSGIQLATLEAVAHNFRFQRIYVETDR